MTVHFGDQHVGSTVALCPPRVELDGGGIYESSAVQSFYWQCWLRFWQDVADIKKRIKADVIGICGGDEGEGDHHNTTQIWFEEKVDQERAIEQVLDVAAPVVDRWVFIRGTPSHEDAPEARARRLADKFDVIQTANERYSHWAYTGVHGGVKFEVAHAPGTNSWVPHTKGAACARHSQYTRAEYFASGIEPPDVLIRHHVHYWQGPGCSDGTCTFFVPGWQAPTTWVRGRGVKSAAPAGFIPGGLVLICQDGRYTHDWRLYQPPTEVAWSK